MIGAACESAEKVIADMRKTYFGTRQGPTTIPTLDKVQAAKIQEQETLLRNAVNQGEGVVLDCCFTFTVGSLRTFFTYVIFLAALLRSKLC